MGLPVFVVREGRTAAALVAAAAYDYPAAVLDHAIAVTGTNGKSTTVSLLRHLFDIAGAPAASIGTIGVFVGSVGQPLDGGAGLTTPGPIELQRVLRTLVDQGVRTIALEASSHSLDQQRVGSLSFDAVVFTNLTRDHFDYHKTMEAYLAAKAKLLGYLQATGVAIVNADDPAWSALPPTKRTVRFSTHDTRADVRAQDIQTDREAARGSWQLGRHTATLCTFRSSETSTSPMRSARRRQPGRSGSLRRRLRTACPTFLRFQVVSRSCTIAPWSFVITHTHRTRWSGRSERWRPLRAGGSSSCLVPAEIATVASDRKWAIADRLADVVILTSDNPRTEDPERILDDIEQGMTGPRERIEDREQAVLRALAIAGPDDLVLLAGKGHETYQVRGTTYFPLDEQMIVRRVLAGR